MALFMVSPSSRKMIICTRNVTGGPCNSTEEAMRKR
jgi:hypothetical protein